MNPIYKGMSYDGIVRTLIRERYSMDDELAIQRQRDTKQAEFTAYYEFAEECKIRAKEIMEGENGSDT